MSATAFERALRKQQQARYVASAHKQMRLVLLSFFVLAALAVVSLVWLRH